MAMIDDLAAAFDNHQVTDDNGAILDEGTSLEESAPSQEQTAEEDTAQVETTAESESEAPQVSEDDLENVVAEDESGRKYIPEKRWNKLYAQKKELERKLEAQEALRLNPQMAQATQKNAPKTYKVDPTVAQLETEMLLEKFPEFDPNSPEYSEVLDQTAYDIWRANEGQISRMEAARQARKRAAALTQGLNTIKVSNMQFKSQTADGGMASRPASTRPNEKVDIDKMSASEMESYLKRTGNW